MLELLEGVGTWLIAADDANKLWGLTRPLAHRLRNRRRARVIYAGGGFEFYATRQALNIEHPSLGKRLANANVQSVDAAWPIGQNFYHQKEELHRVKRLLLPRPEAAEYYAKTVGQSGVGAAIREVTKLALKRPETKVAWCKVFLGASVTLVDTDKPTGWVHVEPTLPYSIMRLRSSYTIYKRHSEEAVMEMQRIFNELWEGADKQTGA